MRFPIILNDDDLDFNQPNGLSVSEDDQKVYVSASLPGVEEKDIDITFDKGVLWIKGEQVDEDSSDKVEKKYYKRASSRFSYSVTVPGDLDNSNDPVATYKHGVMTVVFAKKPESQPKKIKITGHK